VKPPGARATPPVIARKWHSASLCVGGVVFFPDPYYPVNALTSLQDVPNMLAPSRSTLIAQAISNRRIVAGPPHLRHHFVEVQRDDVMRFDSESSAIKKRSYFCFL